MSSSAHPQVDPDFFQSPVVFFNNGIGDYILTLPTFRALATIFEGRLSLICREGFFRLLFEDLPLKQVLEVKHSRSNGVRVFDAEGIASQVDYCDLFISANPWHSQAVDTLVSKLDPKCSVGYFSAFDIEIQRDYSWHAVDMAFQLATALAPNATLSDFTGPLNLPERFRELPRLVRKSIPDLLDLLIVHTDTEIEKLWAERNFISVIDNFLERHTNYLAIVVGLKMLPTEQSRFPARYIDFTDIHILKTFGLIALSDLFLGIDSCMLHVADIFRVPGVGLFGPTDHHHFGFRFAQHRHVLGNGTMDRIETKDVLQALVSLAS